MLFAFRMHNHFTWQHDKAHSFGKRFLQFHIASGIGLALRHLSFGIMVYTGIDKYIAGAVSSILAAIVNYFCYDRIVFKAAKND